YHVGGSTLNKYKDKVQDVVEFTFVNTSREHAGRYQCQYRVPESEEISEKSDPVELVLTNHGFPPPGISLQGKERVGTGTNVTIHCWNKDYGAAFLLHKDGRSAPIQRQDRDGGGTATFTLLGVTPSDAGTYRCSYHPKDYPFVSSRLGSSVTLEVTPTAATPGRSEPPVCVNPLPWTGGCVTASSLHGGCGWQQRHPHPQTPQDLRSGPERV
ncbi:leukocyte immunoglobulin-like receptor subfamily B member 2, partial [Numida meleagris]|uniref:leukocyte immunoglobulin-like receptor subfamily B member 2 n=1 Tax=Numida meleagris TaxID=8996 RepID=UPI000B3DE20D